MTDIKELLSKSGIKVDLLKVALSNKLMPVDYRQNTQISKDERAVISLCEAFANFVGYYSVESEKLILNAIMNYCNYGVSLDRYGRKEGLKAIENMGKSMDEEEREKSKREFLLS